MQYGDEKKEKLEKLEKKLYSRKAPDVIETESDLDQYLRSADDAEEVKEDWQDTKNSSFDETAAKVSNMARTKHNFVRKIFIFSALFFVAACAAAAFVFLGGVNSISSKNVDIKVSGPVSVGSGQEVSLDIEIVNNNNVDLESASLLLEYPEGTRSAANMSEDLTQERFSLDKIKSGESDTQNIKAVFFGDKGTTKQLKISLEYRVQNSSALFYKEKIQEISISSAPIIITPTYPKEVNSNQEISFNVEIASNSKDKIDNFLVNVEYPFGFVFGNSSPAASFGNNIWKLSDLAAGEKRTISIKGSIIGQDNEERVFRISAGTADESDERTIAIPFTQLTESVMVKKPFIGLDFLVNGKSDNAAVKGGNQVEANVVVKNNLSSKLYNISVEVSFSGGAFDKSNVFPNNDGFFKSSNSTIIWDKRSVSEFSEMGAGSEKNLSFNFFPLSYENILSGSKSEMEMTVTVKGETISESGSVESVSATETRKVVLATNISLSSKTARSLGNLENSGPIPPKVDIPTTYTVIWNVNNSLNQISNVSARATLPSYVKFTGLKSPQNESLSYDESSNEMVWNIGSMLPSSEKKVYFQLEFLPSSSQIGQTVVLLGQTSLSGLDKVTGQNVKANTSAVTTNFSGDSTFNSGDDKVTQ